MIYVGSFSKVLLPTLRMGFLVAPASLRSAPLTAKQLTDWHGDLMAQAALARFIDSGLLVRQIHKVMRVYAARHARILESLERRCHRRLRAIPSAAGLHLAAVTEGPSANLRRPSIAHGAAAPRSARSRTTRSAPRVPPASSLDTARYLRQRIDDGLRQLAASFV